MSDYVVAAVLSQKHHDGILRPVAFMSNKMSPAECNYEIYDKKLLAIIRAFEEWHPELAGTPIKDPIHGIPDHKNLDHFMSTKDLNRRQARWAECLAEFNFQITYRPGKSGTIPDSLTRRPGDLPEDASDSRHLYQHQTVLKRKNLDQNMQKALRLASLINSPYEESTPALAAMLYDLSKAKFPSEIISEDKDKPTPTTMDEIWKAYTENEIAKEIIQAKLNGLRKVPYDITKNHFKLELRDCQVLDNLFYVKTRFYVPPNKDNTLYTSIIKEVHPSLPGGRAGRSSTYDRLSRCYYSPRMTDMVARFIRSCDICKRSKSYRVRKQGLLKPLPIPDRYWTDISIDFITSLPVSLRYGRKYQHIMVVVDRLFKKKKFVPLDSLEVEAVV